MTDNIEAAKENLRKIVSIWLRVLQVLLVVAIVFVVCAAIAKASVLVTLWAALQVYALVIITKTRNELGNMK
jgi:hypothetical protein